MADFAAFAKEFTVVGGKDDERSVENAALAQFRDIPLEALGAQLRSLSVLRPHSIPVPLARRVVLLRGGRRRATERDVGVVVAFEVEERLFEFRECGLSVLAEDRIDLVARDVAVLPEPRVEPVEFEQALDLVGRSVVPVEDTVLRRVQPRRKRRERGGTKRRLCDRLERDTAVSYGQRKEVLPEAVGEVNDDVLDHVFELLPCEI